MTEKTRAGRAVGLLMMLVSSAVVIVFVWWASKNIYGLIYDFNYDQIVRDTIKEMVKEESLK